MNADKSPDDLLLALRDLAVQESSPTRSTAILAAAAQTIARRRRLAEYRLVLEAAAYGQRIAPFAAGTLAAAFVAAALTQVVVVLVRARELLLGP